MRSGISHDASILCNLAAVFDFPTGVWVLCHSVLAPIEYVIHAGQLFQELVPIGFLKGAVKFTVSLVCGLCWFFNSCENNDIQNIDSD